MDLFKVQQDEQQRVYFSLHCMKNLTREEKDYIPLLGYHPAPHPPTSL